LRISGWFSKGRTLKQNMRMRMKLFLWMMTHLLPSLEEVAANAIVAYQVPEYRGEPKSMFERQVLYRLGVISAEQRAHFEATHARFQHLDNQIEGVQAQLAELYYKDQ